MSKTFWIIENFSKEKSYQELQEAVKNGDYPHYFINGDFKSEELIKSLPPSSSKYFCGDYPVLFCGSIETSKLVSHYLFDLGKQPVWYCCYQRFKCSSYYSYFGDLLFNDKYALISLSELKRNLYLFYGVFGKDSCIFIRPDSGEKTFQAQVLDIIDFDSFYAANQHLAHELVLVSTPKNIVGEWRVVCSKEGVIDYSLYRYQGNISKIHAAPKEVLDFAAKIAKVDYKTDPIFCVDVCTADDGKPYLLELTSFSTAGLYDCDKNKIVKSVSEITEKNFSLTQLLNQAYDSSE